ncbi:MAG TPA: Spy/CpxP family protein refolding chaperone [Duganella sp.]|uniref:Spy/CpxP family protein refolding chaperone n=1 Tax=Duganella sp. TaxID=1904440 RepID=UPI002ECFE6B0
MNTKKTGVHKRLLAMAMALPLLAMGGAGANEMGGEHPPMMHNGPDRDGPPDGPRMDGGMPPFIGPGMIGRPSFMRGVELSEAQEDKIFTILHEEKPYLREQGKAAAKANEALRELAGADKYDDAKAAALAQAAATAMANIALQRARTEQKLLAVLTPEQRKKQEAGRDGREPPRRPRPENSAK